MLKIYLLFFPKNFSYYSFFILVFSLLFHNNAHLVSVASRLVFKMLLQVVLPELINSHK